MVRGFSEPRENVAQRGVTVGPVGPSLEIAVRVAFK